jgi:quinol monooxygenase YgiN
MSHIIVARWRPRTGEEEKIAAILRALAKKIRAEPGNVSFAAHRAKDDPNDILLYEVYESEAAFNTHRETAHFKTHVLGEAVPLLAFREVRAYSVDDSI